MAEKMIENNRVSVIGEIVSEFSFSHEVFGEGFYMVDLSVNRLSEQADVIPLMVSERLMDVHKDLRGRTIEAVGQFRSYNRHEGVKNRLMLSVFAREIRFLDGIYGLHQNQPDFPGRLHMQSAPSTEKHLLDARLQTFCWRLTALMENQITYPVSAGEEMPALPPALR